MLSKNMKLIFNKLSEIGQKYLFSDTDIQQTN